MNTGMRVIHELRFEEFKMLFSLTIAKEKNDANGTVF